MDQQTKQYIAAEIARMKTELKAELLQEMSRQITLISSRVNTKIETACKDMKESQDQSIVAINSKQLATRDANLEKKILDTVQHTYGKQIGKTMEWLNYNTMDYQDLTQQFQMGVMTNDEASNRKLLTGRESTKHIISEHVRFAFEFDDDEATPKKR